MHGPYLHCSHPQIKKTFKKNTSPFHLENSQQRFPNSPCKNSFLGTGRWKRLPILAKTASPFLGGKTWTNSTWFFFENAPRCQSISALASSSSACWSSRWISKTSTPGGDAFFLDRPRPRAYWGFLVRKWVRPVRGNTNPQEVEVEATSSYFEWNYMRHPVKMAENNWGNWVFFPSKGSYLFHPTWKSCHLAECLPRKRASRRNTS